MIVQDAMMTVARLVPFGKVALHVSIHMLGLETSAESENGS